MPYIARNFANQRTAVGNGQCVTLVKHFAGAPPSSSWREGPKVMDMLKTAGGIASGTVIATFEDGRYPNRPRGNHAAIFVRAVPGGIEVFDQWFGHAPAMRTLRFGHGSERGAAQRPELYSVVQ